MQGDGQGAGDQLTFRGETGGLQSYVVTRVPSSVCRVVTPPIYTSILALRPGRPQESTL